MTLRTALAVLAASGLVLGSGGCADTLFAGEPGSCSVGLDQLSVFPADGTVGVSPYAVVRVLAPEGGAGLTASLVDSTLETDIVLARSTTSTEYGDLIEFEPDRSLTADTLHVLRVTDGDAELVFEGTFWTGEADSASDGVGSGAALDVQPVPASGRSCCSGPCRDGTRLQIPAPELGHLPQLVLLQVRELYNDRCGAASRPVVTVPTIADAGQVWLTAETDRILVGCFEATLAHQAGGWPGTTRHGCTQGVEWQPLAADPDCLEVGCSGTSGPPTTAVVCMVLAAAAWLWTRGRRARRLWQRVSG